MGDRSAPVPPIETREGEPSLHTHWKRSTALCNALHNTEGMRWFLWHSFATQSACKRWLGQRRGGLEPYRRRARRSWPPSGRPSLLSLLTTWSSGGVIVNSVRTCGQDQSDDSRPPSLPCRDELAGCHRSSRSRQEVAVSALGAGRRSAPERRFKPEDAAKARLWIPIRHEIDWQSRATGADAVRAFADQDIRRRCVFPTAFMSTDERCRSGPHILPDMAIAHDLTR